LDLFQTRYEGGVDTYLQVVTWQTAALNNQRNDLDILQRRLDASVLLVKALGGGWDATKLPHVQETEPGREAVPACRGRLRAVAPFRGPFSLKLSSLES
jgi:hypothetical protein